VDELVVNVGIGTDDTRARVEAWVAKHQAEGSPVHFVLFESHWPLDDPEKKKAGLILSEQTNLALDRCTGDWCIYLQADEVFHEADYPKIRAAMKEFEATPPVEGLVFEYLHFYGSFDVVQKTRSAYRREVRAFKRSSGARSIGDAQSFRKPDGSKLAVARTGVRVFHYGWVRNPEAMREKTYFMDQLYHGQGGKPGESGVPHTGDNYRYKKIWGLHPFRDTHPRVMNQRIAQKGWHWDLTHSPLEWRFRDIKKVVLDTFERVTGVRLFEYRSYKQVR
jgi:hypothetical protein